MPQHTLLDVISAGRASTFPDMFLPLPPSLSPSSQKPSHESLFSSLSLLYYRVASSCESETKRNERRHTSCYDHQRSLPSAT